MTPQLRVLFVIPGSPEGFSMVFARRQVASLERAGVIGHVFHLRSRMSPVAIAKEWVRLRREILDFAPDLLHAHFGTMTAFFSVLATRLPVVVTYRGSDLNPVAGQPLLDPLRRLLSHLAALRAAQITCVSPQLKERLIWSRDRATVIPTGVDSTLFYPRCREEARRRVGWSPDEPVVLFNAGWSPEIKRVDVAHAAVEVARSRCGSLRFEVLDGGHDPCEVPWLMNAADCLLLTSDHEGSPTIVSEAIASGLPVVSVEVGDVAIQLAGVTPSCITRRDPEALGAGICEILARRQRSNGPEIAAQRLSLDVLAHQLLDVYEKARRSR
jgi:glycosyltransferase involved in cell wall biosynthesis